METIQYTVKLDLTDNGCFDTGWRIKQGDNGIPQILALVVNNDEPFSSVNPPTIAFKRPDGKTIIGNMLPVGNRYSYTFAGNELEVAGTIIMDIKFSDESGRVSTASCKFTCVEDTIGYDPDGSHTYNNPVSELVEMALENSEESEAWAVGTRNGVPVPEEDETYHNNAKYWAEHPSESTIDKTVTSTTSPLTDSADDTIKAITLKGNSYKDGEEIIIPSGDVVSHSKNLLNSTLQTTTQNGVTCTRNSDGTYTLNGTATAEATFFLINETSLKYLNKTYKLVGCPQCGNGSYFLRITDITVGSNSDIGNGCIYTLKGSGIRVYISVKSGTNCNGLVFKPMFTEDFSATYDDYTPYAKSTIHTDRPLLSVNDIRNELIIDKDGNGTFTERVILQNDELVVKETPTTEALTPQEISTILSLKTFDGNTYIDTDGCPFEITYNVNSTIGTLYTKTEDLQKQIDEIDASEIYSTDEILIGKFLDKDLFRKVFRTTESVSSSNKEYAQTNASGIKNIINIHFVVEHSDFAWCISAQGTIKNGHIYAEGKSNDTPTSGMYTNIIVEYTKS